MRAQVTQACAEGKFAVYAVSTIHEAIEVLTGMPAGERDEEGHFPDDTVNAKVEEQMVHFATVRRDFDAEEKDGKDGEDSGNDGEE